MGSEEYQINDYITLKLEFIETLIYVDNEVFIGCKGLFFNTLADRLEDLEFISSIDELEEKLEEHLHLVENPIKTLPEAVKNLEYLQILEFKNNHS